MKKTAKKIAISVIFALPVLFLGTNGASAWDGGRSSNERELISRVHEANAGWDWEPRCAGGAEWDWDDMRCEEGTGDHHGDHHNRHHHRHHHNDD